MIIKELIFDEDGNAILRERKISEQEEEAMKGEDEDGI
jgi:hypothetical protein